MPLVSASDQLELRARRLVESLDGAWSRSHGMCRCPAHPDRTPSLSVTIGRRAILFHCFAGCTNAAVIRGLATVGIRPSELFNGSGASIDLEPRLEGSRRRVLRLWKDADSLAGTPAARYLADRGITLCPPELRFHPRMPLGPKGSARFLPAMVAAVRHDLGIIALHRTFFDPDGPSVARFQQPKRALGRLGAGAVRLASPRGGRMGLAEGMETALSATQLFGIPCWATLGNVRFGLVTIPDSVRELHLFVDHDAGGDLAEERAREAYAREGRRIVTRRPGRFGQDWNDVLKERHRAPAWTLGERRDGLWPL